MPVRFVAVGLLVATFSLVVGCRGPARVAEPSSSRSAEPSVPPLLPATGAEVSPVRRETPGAAPVLRWVADWEGARPRVFAGSNGEAVLGVWGEAKLAGVVVTGDAKGRKDTQFWLVRLSMDRVVRSAVAVAVPLEWAQALAVLDDGDVMIDASRPGEGHSLLRVRRDGTIAWARPLPKGLAVRHSTADAGSGRMALALEPVGRQLADPEYGVSSEGRPPDAARRSTVQVFAGDGTPAFEFEVTCPAWCHVSTLALGADGSLAAAGSFMTSVEVTTKPPIRGTEPQASWFLRLGARGEPGWFRTLARHSGWSSPIRIRADSTVWLAGEAAPARFVRASLLDQPATLGKPPVAQSDPILPYQTPPPAPGDEALAFSAAFDETTGKSKGLYSLESGWHRRRRADIGLFSHRTFESGDEVLAATSDEGLELFRLPATSASFDQVATLGDGSLVVAGAYPSVLTYSGLVPPAVLVSGKCAQAYLAWYAPRAFATTPSGVRTSGLYDSTRTDQASLGADRRERFRKLTAEALRAFRAKRYAEACPLFAAAQVEDPWSAANMGELGLCWQRQEDTDCALTASHYALSLLARTPSSNDPDQRRPGVESAILHNLGAIGGGRRLAFSPQSCVNIDSDTPACDKPIHACGRLDSYGRTAASVTLYNFARFALSAKNAAIDDIPEHTWPALGASTYDTSSCTGTCDITLEQNDEAEDESSECKLVHADGCSGFIAFSCVTIAKSGGRLSKPTVFGVKLTE